MSNLRTSRFQRRESPWLASHSIRLSRSSILKIMLAISILQNNWIPRPSWKRISSRKRTRFRDQSRYSKSYSNQKDSSQRVLVITSLLQLHQMIRIQRKLPRKSKKTPKQWSWMSHWFPVWRQVMPKKSSQMPRIHPKTLKWVTNRRSKFLMTLSRHKSQSKWTLSSLKKWIKTRVR